jgi:23S rRNA pseudouridine1911/1915/1917 synthase
MTEAIDVVVPALLDGVRVDRAICMLTGASRTEAARLVREGKVTVGDSVVSTRSTPLAEGSRLCVEGMVAADAPLLAEPDVSVDVVYDDDDVIVVNKQAGLVVHPGAGRTQGTLAAGLLARYPDLADLVASGTSDPERPGIVHRLDRGTSGLLVVGRSEVAMASLRDQLAARTMERRYIALVHGEVNEERGVIDAPIGRSTRTPTKMAVAQGGRSARTAYEVLGRTEDPVALTLVALRLETGRTHQIRVHMNAIGHPVVGDDRYSQHDGHHPRLGLAPGRVFLHAAVLGFVHPTTGAARRWRAELPSDLVAAAPFAAGAVDLL